jgi:hypothetical protein
MREPDLRRANWGWELGEGGGGRRERVGGGLAWLASLFYLFSRSPKWVRW